MGYKYIRHKQQLLKSYINIKSNVLNKKLHKKFKRFFRFKYILKQLNLKEYQKFKKHTLKFKNKFLTKKKTNIFKFFKKKKKFTNVSFKTIKFKNLNKTKLSFLRNLNEIKIKKLKLNKTKIKKTKKKKKKFKFFK